MIVIMEMEIFVYEMGQPFRSSKAKYSHGNQCDPSCYWHLVLSCGDNPYGNYRHELQCDLKCSETFMCHATAAAIHHMRPVPAMEQNTNNLH